MRVIVTRANRLQGTLRVPGDKSISHRAVLFGALARGTTRITGIAAGADVRSSIACVESLGARVRHEGDGIVEVASEGRGAWANRSGRLDAGNSGTTVRLLMGMLASVPGLDVTLEGDASLSRRPMRRIADPLRLMGADLSLADGDRLPARVRGAALQGVSHELNVASAQLKTALLLAGLQADGETWVSEPAPSRDHTERLLPAFGATIHHGPKGVGVVRQELTATTIDVPGDPSSAAFFAAAAALVPDADVRIERVGTNPTRTGVVDVLRAMGARVDFDDENPAAEPFATWACGPGALRATRIEGALVPRLVDEIPVLAVVAALADGETVIADAAELRVKESDRIRLVCDGLRAMGANVDERPDGLVVRGGRPLHGARIDAGHDHRIAMSFAIAGLVADGETVIDGAEWADVSFPGFFDELGRLTNGAVRIG